MTSMKKEEMSFPRVELQAVIAQSRTNRYSMFYRERFHKVSEGAPAGMADWQSIPYLTREEIVAAPLWERTFVPRQDVEVVRNTYGTSGEKSLLTPRILFGDYASLWRSLGASRIMNLYSMAFYSEGPRRKDGGLVIGGDHADLGVSIALLKLFRADSILGGPFEMVYIGQHLTDAERANIKVIEAGGGERCSLGQIEEMHATFPNVSVVVTYASSEARGIVATSCLEMVQKRSNLMHMLDEHFFLELIDPDVGGSVTAVGRVGEMVLTSLDANLPLPLIRYRTGDLARYMGQCPCGKGQLIDVIGRAEKDRIRILEGELLLPEFERVVRALPGVHPDLFEMRYEEQKIGNRTLPQVRLLLTPTEGEKLDFVNLARQISRTLHVSLESTYEEKVLQGRYLPLLVEVLKMSDTKNVWKKQRFFFRT